MVFQPIADLRTGGVVGVEALARFGCQPLRPPNEWLHERPSAAASAGAAAVEAAVAHLGPLPPPQASAP